MHDTNSIVKWRLSVSKRYPKRPLQGEENWLFRRMDLLCVFNKRYLTVTGQNVQQKADICFLLGYYETHIGNSLPTFRDLLSFPCSRARKFRKKFRNKNLFKDAAEHRAQPQTIPASSRTTNNRTVWRKLKRLLLECSLSLYHGWINVSCVYCVFRVEYFRLPHTHFFSTFKINYLVRVRLCLFVCF